MQTLADALTRLRNLKSQAKRATEIVKSSVRYDEDSKPEYVYLDEICDLRELDDQIVDLKAQIQRTNALTVVDFDGASMTLTEVILWNARVRADLAFYQELMKTGEEDRLYRSARTKDTVKQVWAEGFSKADVRKTIEALEARKEHIDSFLNSVNQKTTLVA